MGLDMFLRASVHVARYDHNQKDTELGDDLLQVLTRHTGIPFEAVQQPSNSINVEVTAVYWRKANAIHQWFVDNVQNGVDDCGTYSVSAEDLQRLADLCDEVLSKIEMEDGQIHTSTVYSGGDTTAIVEDGKVIANPEVAEALLPTTSGFFFGSTAYNEYYIEDLRYTRDRLRELLAIPTAGRSLWYEYHASW
jgi:hypothetical protein